MSRFLPVSAAWSKITKVPLETLAVSRQPAIGLAQPDSGDAAMSFIEAMFA
jgi:hypothetical protein